MKYKAIIFDLGGTLVHQYPVSKFTDIAMEMADVLTAPKEKFVQLWFDKANGLIHGVYKSYQECIQNVCGQLGVNVQDSQIDQAASLPFEMMKNMVMVPREGSIKVLTYLKSNNFQTGLISDCTADVPVIWKDTPFAPLIDVAIFSCSVGMSKANQHIFEMAVEELAAKPTDCIYVADGFRQELANASKLGMLAIQIIASTNVHDESLREDWKGPIISSLLEIIPLLK